MHNHVWYNSVGETTCFYQYGFDVPSASQHLCDYTELMKWNKQRSEKDMLQVMQTIQLNDDVIEKEGSSDGLKESVNANRKDHVTNKEKTAL